MPYSYRRILIVTIRLDLELWVSRKVAPPSAKSIGSRYERLSILDESGGWMCRS